MRSPVATPLTANLTEWLIRSADITATDASKHCTGSLMDTSRCDWYHGSWQYLRLMNLVSSPSWHHDFYMRVLKEATDVLSPRVLISGTADYSMYAYVLEAQANNGKTSKVTIVDMCETPLLACKWLGDQVSQQPITRKEDIRRLAATNQDIFDCICTDAFLTRFKGEEVDEVLVAWLKLLKPGGSIVTTVRIYGLNDAIGTSEDIRDFVDRATSRWTQYQGQLGPGSKEIIERAEIYARHMISNSLGSKEIVLEKLSRSFQIVYSEATDVQGELLPSRYLRLVLKRKT